MSPAIFFYLLQYFYPRGSLCRHDAARRPVTGPAKHNEEVKMIGFDVRVNRAKNLVFAMLRVAFPDRYFTVEDQIAEPRFEDALCTDA